MEIFGAYHGYFMTFIIGLVVGIIAKFLMPGKDPGGFIITAILGILGSFLATWLGRTLTQELLTARYGDSAGEAWVLTHDAEVEAARAWLERRMAA